MSNRKAVGWQKLCEGFPWFEGENRYPIRAYSEYMPPQKTGVNPSNGKVYPWVFDEDDHFGWTISEMEEEFQLRPGLEDIGKQIMEHLVQLGEGTLSPILKGHQGKNLINNPYWPPELNAHTGRFNAEQYPILLPMSLSKTKDDKGRVRWTFFGASEQGPEKAFWKSFYKSETEELPESDFLEFIGKLLSEAYGKYPKTPAALLQSGFRILPSRDHSPLPYWRIDKLPSWTKQYQISDGDPIDDLAFLLTFRPFGSLPQPMKDNYLAGKLALLPFPGSLLLWGNPSYLKLQPKLHTAIQIPMLRLVRRNEGGGGIRVPQSGWLKEPRLDGVKAEILEENIVNSYIRTNRWDKVMRHEDGLLKSTEVDPVVETLFSTTLKSLDLYNKPMARNCHLFDEQIELILDGPRASRKDIGKAALQLLKGGLFRYRFYFPPMQVGVHEVFWHRPLAGCLSSKTRKLIMFPELLSGYLTAYNTSAPDPANPVELWPRFKHRDLEMAIVKNFDTIHDHYHHQTSLNLMTLLEIHEIFGNRPTERDFARRLIRIPKKESLEQWLDDLPEKSLNANLAKKVKMEITGMLEAEKVPTKIPPAITYHETATRAYEEAYWNQIHFLAHGQYINKDNADVVHDHETLGQVIHKKRDLHNLGDYLIRQYRKAILETGMKDKAEAGELPFHWKTDFEFNHFGGWKANQEGTEYERNILVIIPGKNRNEAVIMADHYDTAYMEDVYDTSTGGTGARLSAAGADDNHSATSTLLLAAPVFLKMAKEGKLERDIWLLHLTGEEFPSDCMGARNFCQNFIQKTLQVHLDNNSKRDLSHVQITGVFVMDMIAHNRDNARDIFQIAPGKTMESMTLAYQAHLATRAWNLVAEKGNGSTDRAGCFPGKRCTDEHTIPAKALFLQLEGEVRTCEDPHSTLYNTDGMIFSDHGIPVVLFMENYDIHRTGYHDTHDTMENIDLDYGSAVSAIAIETVARVATQPAI